MKEKKSFEYIRTTFFKPSKFLVSIIFLTKTQLMEMFEVALIINFATWLFKRQTEVRSAQNKILDITFRLQLIWLLSFLALLVYFSLCLFVKNLSLQLLVSLTVKGIIYEKLTCQESEMMNLALTLTFLSYRKLKIAQQYFQLQKQPK